MRRPDPASLTDHLAAYYAAVATEYDDWLSGIHRQSAERLVGLAAPTPGETVVDIGCGTGLMTRWLADCVGPDGTVVGVDLSEPMLQIAGKRAAANTRLVFMSADDLTFTDSFCTLVCMGELLSYIDDPRRALREALRVLRPGGRLAVSCLRRSLMSPAQELYLDTLHELQQYHPLVVPRVPDERGRLGEPELLETLLAHCGFVDVTMTSMVTGRRAADAHEWTEVMMGSGPLAFELVSVLGPEPRRRFEETLTNRMATLGEDAFLYHHALTFAVGYRPRVPG